MSNPDVALASNDILLVDDDLDTLNALRRVLQAEQYLVDTASTGEDAIKRVESAPPHIILLDLGLPDADGVELLRTLLCKGVKHVIIVSGTGCAETTRSCLRAGAFDFILKPAGRDELLQAVRRATSVYEVGQVTTQSYPLELKPGFGALETPSDKSQQLFSQLKKMSTSSPANALIGGPAGLFKRDIAALIHHYNGRSGPALLINCALETDNDTLRRFTKTVNSNSKCTHVAYTDQAIDGSLILDDISLLPSSVQRWLATYIKRANTAEDQTQEASRRQSFNIIGILRESADLALSEGRLDSELYTGLSINHILVPALNERIEDVAVYARRAIAQLNTIFQYEKSMSQEFVDFLTTQPWEGNLVELKNRLLIAYRGTENGEEIVHDPLLWPSTKEVECVHTEKATGVAGVVGVSLDVAERRLIKATLASVDDNKRQAAKILGISVKTLYNRLKR